MRHMRCASLACLPHVLDDYGNMVDLQHRWQSVLLAKVYEDQPAPQKGQEDRSC